MRIDVGVAGRGRAGAADARARLHARGLGAAARAARAPLPGALVRQPRHRRERDPAGAVHRRGARRRRGAGARRGGRRARARRRREPRRLRGAGARRRAARARRPARARLHLARRRRRLPAARGDAAADGRGAVARARGRAAPLRRERARARTRPRRSSTRSSPTGRRTRPTRPAGRRRPPRAPPGTRATGCARIAAPTLVVAGTADQVVDPRNSQLLADAIPDARLELIDGVGPPALLGAARGVRGAASKGSSDDAAHDRPDAPRPRAHDAGPRRDRGRRPRLDVRRPRPRAPTSSPRSLERGVARLDADRQHGRARRRLLRVREGGRDPAPDLVAARAGRDRLPARRRRAGASSSSRTSSASSPTRRSRSRASRRALELPAAQAARGRPSRTTRCSSSTRAAPPASRRARCSRTRTASGRTSPSTSRPASRQHDVVLQVLPQFHVGGWNVQSLLAWWKGARVVLERGFDAARALELIESRAGHDDDGRAGQLPLHGAGARGSRRADLSSLRLAVVGGAPMPVPLLDTWAERGVEIVQGYGLTEAAPNVLCLPPEDARRKAGSAGKPYPYVECELAEDGELLVRGPNVFAGYWRNPEATAAAFRDGWLLTGDVAERDEEGDYWMRGRIKELVVSGGENVYPAEIEAVLHDHPGGRRGGGRRRARRALGRGLRRLRRDRASRSRSRSCARICRSGSRASRCRRRSTSSTRCRATRSARCRRPSSGRRWRDDRRRHRAPRGRPLSARGLDTRRRLLDAAERVFGEVGYLGRVDREDHRGRRRRRRAPSTSTSTRSRRSSTSSSATSTSACGTR